MLKKNNYKYLNKHRDINESLNNMLENNGTNIYFLKKTIMQANQSFSVTRIQVMLLSSNTVMSDS